MSGGRSVDDIMKAAAKLNAHVATLDQKSDTALVIKEIFFHLNHINEETEKVIMLSDLIKDNKSSRIDLLGNECKQLLVNFYHALLTKVNLEIIDGLIKIENYGEIPGEPRLSEERHKIENILFEKNTNANDVNDKLEKLNLEKKIVMLEAMLEKQHHILLELAETQEQADKKESVQLAMQQLHKLQNDYRKIYDQQHKLVHEQKRFQIIPDEFHRRAGLANDRENAVSLHATTLHSTVGRNHPRAQRFQKIHEIVTNEGNPVTRAFLLGNILEQEVEGKSLLKPDLVVMKQYHTALLQLAAIRLIDELIGEEKLAKLNEPWLSIERSQVTNRIISHGDNHAHDPCQDVVFTSAMTTQEQERMKLVLLQATKLHLQISNNHTPESTIDVTRLITYLEVWERKYKDKINREMQAITSTLFIFKDESQDHMVEDSTSKKRWRIWNIFTKNKR